MIARCELNARLQDLETRPPPHLKATHESISVDLCEVLLADLTDLCDARQTHAESAFSELVFALRVEPWEREELT